MLLKFIFLATVSKHCFEFNIVNLLIKGYLNIAFYVNKEIVMKDMKQILSDTKEYLEKKKKEKNRR